MQIMDNSLEKSGIQSPSADSNDVCEIEKKECLDNCTMLYSFVSDDLHKFSILHQVFGACNVIKLIKDLPSDKIIDAINSMVYEASARLHDPAFGCTGIIQQLQLQISDLQLQITATRALLQKMRSPQAQILASRSGLSKFIDTINTSPNEDDDRDEDLLNSNPMD